VDTFGIRILLFYRTVVWPRGGFAMRKFTCDKCHREMAEYEIQAVFISVTDGSTGGEDIVEADLCPECATAWKASPF
jgi:hypothetical protein